MIPLLNEGGDIVNTTKHTEADEPTLVSMAVAANEVGVSIKTIRRRIADGSLHGYRVGRLIRVNLDELRHHFVVEMPMPR